ncbi:hypothetical protein [Streptomyces sp. NPDC003943]
MDVALTDDHGGTAAQHGRTRVEDRGPRTEDRGRRTEDRGPSPSAATRLLRRPRPVGDETAVGKFGELGGYRFPHAGEHEQQALLLITTQTALRDAFLDTTAGIEPPLTAVITERLGDAGGHTARVLAASVAAAVRIALEGWLRPAATTEAAESFAAAAGLVVPSGSLPDQLRTALAPLAPAFDAAEQHVQP